MDAKLTAAQHRKLIDAITLVEAHGYKVIPVERRACVYCGEVFEVGKHNPRQKYCSSSCKAKGSSAHSRRMQDLSRKMKSGEPVRS